MQKIGENISYMNLKEIIQEEVNNITLEEIYELSYQFKEDVKYLPAEYKKHYRQSVLNVIIQRFKTLKNDDKTYPGVVADEDLTKIRELLYDNADVVTHILNIIVVYATYFLKEPVHMTQTVFPGRVHVYKEGNDYYCPVKKYHTSTSKSVCKYCIAKIPESN